MQKASDAYKKQLSTLDKYDRGDWRTKKLSEMTVRDWRIFREDHNITTKGSGIPNPIRDWKEANLPEWINAAIRTANYKKPSPIQMQAIPIGLQGRDIIGVAETGSGKTAAFVLPMLCYIERRGLLTTEEAAKEGPYAIVLAPTRELAIQIEVETRKFAQERGIRSVCVVGGTDIEYDGTLLGQGTEIVIATPGRFLDCIERRYLVLNQCNYVVLDEADRMIDMGFEPQLLRVLDAMPKSSLKSEDEQEAQKQESELALAINNADIDGPGEHHRSKYRTTIMFSATMPPPVEKLAQKYLRRPATIVIGEVGKAVDRIKQNVIFTKGDGDKRRALEQILSNPDTKGPIIIFMNNKKAADFLAKHITEHNAFQGFKASSIHAGKSQEMREQALEDLKSGKIDILVGTDVLGRGVDIKGVTQVINHDLPKTIQGTCHISFFRLRVPCLSTNAFCQSTHIVSDVPVVQACPVSLPRSLPMMIRISCTICDRCYRRQETVFPPSWLTTLHPMLPWGLMVLRSRLELPTTCN
jgi:ATP-dependent RNA helicase DDX23/PRP28